MLYYGHGSWIVVVVFAAMFVLRMVSSQRRRGGRGGPRGSGTFFSGPGGYGPPGGGRPPGPMGGPRSGGDPTGNGGGATATGTAPGWFADPFFRHEQRYWSGTEWTEHVTDAGTPGTDPPPADPGPRRTG